MLLLMLGLSLGLARAAIGGMFRQVDHISDGAIQLRGRTHSLTSSLSVGIKQRRKAKSTWVDLSGLRSYL